jgi:peptide/nickel transport system permease protein
MGKYITKRILISIPVLIGVVFITFLMLNVIPGDPVTVMMKDHIKPDIIANLRKSMNLDDPMIVRFGRYIWNALHGDLGTSYKFGRPVNSLIFEMFPNTVKLAVSAALVSWIIGIPVGILSAVKRNSLVDRFSMGFALFGVSMPTFFIGLILQFLFQRVLPVSGFDSWKCLILPSIVLGWGAAGSIARMTRSSLLSVLKSDYIRTARAKGLQEILVIIRHALKNSLLPVITMMAIQIADLMSGAVITETVFGIPGIGRLSVTAISNRDMPLLQGTVIFTTMIIILGNLIADILYSVVDPRIRVR